MLFLNDLQQRGGGGSKGYDFWIIVAICESVLSCLKIGLDAALGSIFVNQRRLMKTLLLPSKFVILCE
ncbi:unnamed protein product [Lactuca virosa]|uniref:Uncharacterized protein n=1 Tax=Lactuca virosa TaxID=75947 RepID=A0AAU9LY29_9ASTR|nr:unnamed protein product [Lactuca virosa]